ncbi:MAG TPA: hypothetical protein VJK03_04045 [Candidatus Nanoarchaeia archaeon]|nr:hypothetical protein [Candidatus Nanoarchaeia archaeon]
MKMKVIFGAIAVIFLIVLLTLVVLQERQSSVTGRVASTGSLVLFIQTHLNNISLLHPQNITYNFTPGSAYTLDLNVTSDGTPETWWYFLYDLRHSTIVYNNITFTPNITFNATRWNNLLIVYANDSTHALQNQSVTFYINVPNIAPNISGISSQLYACEGTAFSLSYAVTDPDEDDLQMGISPSSPFFIEPSFAFGETNIAARLFSGNLTKQHPGTYGRTVFATDSAGHIDTRVFNITVIEINEPPTLGGLQGAYTLFTRGGSSSTTLRPTVSDIESGNNSVLGNFTYNASFSGAQLFSINLSTGVAEVAGNSSVVGVHNVSICVTDQGLASISPNVSLCGNTGLNQTTCHAFSITFTDENRAPTIIDYTPSNLTFNVSSGVPVSFHAVATDPDLTVPDFYWYLNGNLSATTIGDFASSYTYSSSCGFSGAQTVRVVATDGLANDSIQWNFTVTMTDCPTGAVSVAGGAAGSAGSAVEPCLPKWGCNDWNVCQNTETSLQSGILSGEDYRTVKNGCEQGNFADTSCGFQIRECLDTKGCLGNFTSRPNEVSECYYVPQPSCFDKVKNCHNGLCEFLVDCGGPCQACATCSDGKENQGEAGIDCGGPCPYQCLPKQPFLKKDRIRILLIWLNLLLLIIILIIIARIVLKYVRRKLDERRSA